MGTFITFEGIDGSGKSTQARLLADRLKADGHEVVLTREPGGSPGAEEIRRLLVEGEPGRWSPDTEMLLFTAARRDHVERTITPALGRDAVVISDRYVDSTRAYQGTGPLRATVDLLHQQMIGLMPDFTLIFDLDPEQGLARAGARAGHETRFEAKGLAFQAELRAAFHDIAQAEPDRCHIVDAFGTAEGVANRVWGLVSERLS
ncbi:MAG: dTMP kinase [Pseudomonadota bacterium]